MATTQKPEPASKEKPEGLRPLGKACQAMNFQLIHESPPTIVTMDHRGVLVPAWAAQVDGIFPKIKSSSSKIQNSLNPFCGNKAPLLLRWDAHPDLGEKPRPWAWEKSLLKDLDAVTSITNRQRHDDGGWVISAMQFGLAGDVLSGGVHEYHRFDGDSEPYEDHKGQRHFLKTTSRLSCLLKEFDRYCEKFGEPECIWFDIDLDFATNRFEDDSVLAWSEDEWKENFPDDELKRWAEILNRSSLITLSLEPWFCGGVEPCGFLAGELMRTFQDHTEVFLRI